MIALSGISKRYGAAEAVRDVSFTAEKGQVLGLLGMNGAGKTTTLNILTGYLAPSAGSVTVGGHDMLADPLRAKACLGYLPEQPPLYDEMTVEAYLRFACDIRRVQKRDIPAHIAEIARLTGLSDTLKRRIGNLSKGYRQRVGLAQALCGDPEALVLDEPTVGLDPRQTAEFRDTLRSLAKGRTVIFSSHILSEVQSLCDRVIILHHGRVICDSALSALQSEGVKRLQVSVALNKEKLLPALRSLPCVLKAQALTQEAPGVTGVLLDCAPDSEPERALFTLLSGLQAPILRLSPAQDTLEDIFLRCTAGE